MYWDRAWGLAKRAGTALLLAGGVRYYFGFVEPLVERFLDSATHTSPLERVLDEAAPQAPLCLIDFDALEKESFPELEGLIAAGADDARPYSDR